MIGKLLTRLATALQGKIPADMAEDPHKRAIGSGLIELVQAQKNKLAAMDEYDRLIVDYRARFDALKVRVDHFNSQSEDWRIANLNLKSELESEQLRLQLLADQICNLREVINGHP